MLKYSFACSITGTLSKYIFTVTSESPIISIKCPNSPKPVTSVIAFAFNSLAASSALSFNAVITSVTSVTAFSLATFFFIAEEIIPEPKGLVKKSLSPT